MTHLAWIEPLHMRPGDRMSLDEFIERWEHMPGLKFAELLEGTVYMPSPVSLAHGVWDNMIQSLSGMYRLYTPGTQAMTNSTWLISSSSAPQPDCSIRIRPEFGGRSSVRNGLAAGVPEFVAEVCYASRSYDLGPKLAVYQSAGVDEYLAVLVEERRFEWRILMNGSYEMMGYDAGIYRSRILPGLWIDSNAFWNEDSAALLQTLEQGLASKEHQDFVARLLASRESSAKS